jgi:ribA/ribD-fused uncharacterized protein
MTSERWPTTDVIGPFEDQYRFLSNFAPVGLRYDGREFSTSEHAYQAAKARGESELYDRIAVTADPDEAKRLGRRASLPSDWDERKRYVMLEVVTAKFGQNSGCREKLLETGEEALVELNSWGDTYWGADIDTGAGRNMLGRILMEVRSALRFNREP